MVNQMIITPASIRTKSASKQAYYTIRFLADSDRADDAYCAYAYFRWVDDIVDGNLNLTERIAFLSRQKTLLDQCYRNEAPQNASPEEQMLIRLIRHDHEKNSGLQTYLRNMMKVMEFDVQRRGRLISQAEFDQYTRYLASAVTEALHYFIGHDSYSPSNQSRYLAVVGAHIVHMLRDTYEDLHAGYYNIPREVLEGAHIAPCDIRSWPYRAWVRNRLHLARRYFAAGREYINRVENIRFRLACFAYIARFECLLNTIERESCILRPNYDERKSLRATYQIGRLTLASMITSRFKNSVSGRVTSHL